MKLNLGAGPHPLKGFINHDPEIDGWRFQDGLLQYPEGSIEAITISHALMYLPHDDWPWAFDEFYRVLKPGGVIRITEDETSNPRSSRYGGYHDAITLTSRLKTRWALRRAGFRDVGIQADQTYFKDRSLIQEWHGISPKIFHVEGIK